MQVEAKKYLHDMSQAIGLLDGFCAGKTFADHERDAMLRAAVERQFEIIGEAPNIFANRRAPHALEVRQ